MQAHEGSNLIQSSHESQTYVPKRRSWFQKRLISSDEVHQSAVTVENYRRKLGLFLESKQYQKIIIALVVLDISILITELVLESREVKCSDDGEVEPKAHWEVVVEHVLKYTSLSILCLFALDIILLILSTGWKYFTHPFYVLDLVVIAAALAIEFTFSSELASFFVLIRLWRIIRIIHAIAEVEEEEKHKLIEEIKKKNAEIDELKRQLQKNH